MAEVTSLITDLPNELPKELVESLLKGRNFRVERIVSRGHTSPPGFWYDQPMHEWVLLLTGAARLEFEDQEPLNLRAGDCVNIAAHQRHRVDWTDPVHPTIWLAVHYQT